MLKFIGTTLLIVLIATWVHAADDLTAAAKQYKELIEAYEQQGGARTFAKRFLALAEQHPEDPAAVDALLWVVEKVRGRADTDAALKLLADRHKESEKLAPACSDVARSRSPNAEPLLRALLEKSPHKSVQAHACYYLAVLLDLEANIVEQLNAEPDLASRVLQYYGKEYGKHLASLDVTELEQEREAVYERMLDSFPNVKLEDRKLGAVATKMLFRIRRLSVGKVAPEIEGKDIAGNSFKLGDYRGKVVMLTFWGHW